MVGLFLSLPVHHMNPHCLDGKLKPRAMNSMSINLFEPDFESGKPLTVGQYPCWFIPPDHTITGFIPTSSPLKKMDGMGFNTKGSKQKLYIV